MMVVVVCRCMWILFDFIVILVRVLGMCFLVLMEREILLFGLIFEILNFFLEFVFVLCILFLERWVLILVVWIGIEFIVDIVLVSEVSCLS